MPEHASTTGTTHVEFVALHHTQPGVEDPFAPAKKAHPGLLIDGLDELAAALEDAGHTVTWDDNFPGYKRFYAEDPFGNRLEFLEPEPR